MKEKKRKNRLLSYKTSRALEELKELAKDKDNTPDESSDEERVFLTTKIEFSKELEKSIKEIFIKTLKYSLPVIGIESILFIVFKLWSGLIGLFLGTVAVFLGLLLLVKSYKSYDIISVGVFKIPKMYGLRYLFYASIFLLSALLTKEPLWGIIGTFIGMMNLKIVIFLFSWRW